MAGKKARCKKCSHSFCLPGGDENAPTASVPGEESTPLSVISDPFAFQAGSAEIGSLPTPVAKAKTQSRSSRKSWSGGSSPTHRRKNGLVVAIALAMLAIAGAACAYVYFNPAKPETPPTKPVAEKPASEPKDKSSRKRDLGKDTPPVDSKDAKDTKPAAPAELANRNNVRNEKAQLSEIKAKRMVTISGAFKLPAPPAKAEKFEKPSIKFEAEHAYAAVQRFFISGGDNPVAVIQWASDGGFQGKGGRDTVDRYNLASGTRIDRTEVDVEPAQARVSDVSPQGEVFACEGPVGTLTIYDLNAKAKTGVAVKPFEDAKPTAALAAIYFLDEKSILVVSKTGLLETWNIREGKRTKNSTLGAGFNDLAAGRTLAMKADRSRLAVVAAGVVHEVPVNTLLAKPVLTLPRGFEKGFALALGDSGDRIVVAYQANQPGLHTMIVSGRANDPKLVQLPIDEAAGIPAQMSFCGPECFVFGFEATAAAVAFETEINKPMAVIFPAAPLARHADGAGKHYVLMSDAADAMKCVVLGVDFPPDDYLPLRNEAVEAKAPVGFLLALEGLGR
jgi:hypothetical protein